MASDLDRERVLEAVRNAVYPADAMFLEGLRGEYLAASREEPGLWSAPNGDDLYRTQILAWTTLELKFNLVRPLSKDTGLVRAEGRIVHRGRTVATSEGDLKDRAGKLYAHATTTCMIFPAKG